MVKIIQRKDVIHRSNQNYNCLLVQFEEGDKHFFKSKSNWMPKHSEVAELIRKMFEIEPEYDFLLKYYLEAITDGIKNKSKEETKRFA